MATYTLRSAGYYPFGETRPGSDTLPTDRLYTGQQENSYIKLMNYRSRWYDPQIGRFVSADSIIPDANPQSLNRYSYVNNDPINYNDPTGHYDCSSISTINNYARAACTSANETWSDKLARYGVTLANSDVDWSYSESAAAYFGVADTAFALGATTGKSAGDAFRAAYSTYNENLVFERVSGGTCGNGSFDTGGCTQNAHLIQFASLSSSLDPSQIIFWGTHNVVHELAHAIVFSISGTIPGSKTKNPNNPINNIPSTLYTDVGWLDYPDSRYWRYHPCADDGSCDGGEVWADMFLGWVYGTYDSSDIGRNRREFMDSAMPQLLSYLGE